MSQENLICIASFPCGVIYLICEGVSRAGSMAGLEDDRTGLISEVVRLVDETDVWLEGNIS